VSSKMSLSRPMTVTDPAQLSAELMSFILGDNLSAKQRSTFAEGSVAYWNEHVNPGFLQYRKSVSDDSAAVEWSGEGCVLKV
jgi:putrescine aminotransferase